MGGIASAVQFRPAARAARALWKVAEHLFPPCSPSSSLESALIERSDPGPDLQLRSTHFTRSQRRSPASGTGLASARGRDRRSHILDLRLRPTTTYGLRSEERRVGKERR